MTAGRRLRGLFPSPFALLVMRRHSGGKSPCPAGKTLAHSAFSGYGCRFREEKGAVLRAVVSAKRQGGNGCMADFPINHEIEVAQHG